MQTFRTLGYAGLLVVAVAAWTRTDARKEFVRLQLSSSSGAAARVHVTSRGLIIIAPQPKHGRYPAQVDTTISAPVELTFAGIGEADFEIVDPARTLVVDVTQVRQQAPPVEHLVGTGFRVSRTTYSEPYRVAASK